jgi:hypothetical protein
MGELINFKDPKNLRTIVNNLDRCCIIKIISRNKIKKTVQVERGYKVYKEKNVYKYLLHQSDIIIKTIVDEKYLINDFYTIYKVCIDNYDFKVSRSFRKNIEKYSYE